MFFLSSNRQQGIGSQGEQGFTLVEMALVITIMSVLIVVSVFEYVEQRKSTALGISAEETVSIIRQAQTYATAVREHEGSFDVGYGVRINQDSAEIELFVVPKESSGYYDYGDSEVVMSYTLDDGIIISDVLEISDADNDLGIVYMRPQVAPYIDEINSVDNIVDTFTEVTVVLESPQGNTQNIVITSAGQISIE